MTKFFCLSILSVILLRCHQPSALSNNNNQQPAETTVAEVKMNPPQSSNHPGNLLTLSDAEKIVGEPAHLSDSSTTTKAGDLVYSCAYTANSKDNKTGKTGVIYFLFEHYKQVASAQKKYTFIKTANENHGIKVLEGLGDEAYFHTDGENFYFIMVRKGAKVFNMKVNKITSTTSLDAFNLVAKKITDAL
jgi:hypothetical protein